MPAPHRTAPRAPAADISRRRRGLVRILALLLALVALVLTSSALNWVTEVRAQDGAPAVKRAVVVAGPVHGQTDRYKAFARSIADAAASYGMEVKRVFHPNATAERVKRVASGANLFVYVGHGNGWPSPYGPFQEDTKNGLGLNPPDPEQRSTSNVVYKGADWLRANIQLAPNAVVILSHLSYASGNASSGMPIPTRDVAVQRVDNYANGFLSIGARVVWALGWQPGADVIAALYQEDATMDAVFMTRYRDADRPMAGWIGHAPGYYESARIPGAVVHIDPDPDYGYLRGITGDLSFTTTEWRDATAAPLDTEPPVISEVRASQAAATLAAAGSAEPIFTPNGDGISDSMGLSFQLSESAFVDMTVRKDGRVVRQTSTWALSGPGTLAWDGRRHDGQYVGEGVFNVALTPTDRAGNVGAPAAVDVRVLSSLKKPLARPALIHPSDGDALAAAATLRAKILRNATVGLTLRGPDGTVVKQLLADAQVAPGLLSVDWDGTDDAGAYVPNARYTARFRVTRPQGSYAHDVYVRVMPFSGLTGKWSLRRGDRVVLKLTSAEPLQGKPRVEVKQPALERYTIRPWKIKRLGPTAFRLQIKSKAAGKAGKMKVFVSGTDTAGGTQGRVFTWTLR